jgi:hypothetical protein
MWQVPHWVRDHKPSASASAEKYYTIRPLKLLRLHHKRIAAHLLEQTRIFFDSRIMTGAPSMRTLPRYADALGWRAVVLFWMATPPRIATGYTP